MLITISNLFPTPGQPSRGLYNLQLFREMGKVLLGPGRPGLNLCLVPEWRLWRWAAIRKWPCPSTAHGLPSTVYLPVFYLPVIGRSINWWFYYRALKRALPEVGRPPHMIYASWLYPDGVAVARLARDLNWPCWLMALGSDTFHLKSSLRRRQILSACETATGVVCVANVLADRLATAGVPRSRLLVAPNGVDDSLFRYRSREEAWEALGTPQTTDYRLQADDRSSLILFVGNLVSIKGPDVMLKAFAKVVTGYSLSVAGKTTESGSVFCSITKNQEPRTKNPLLLIIGSGPLRQPLEGLARRLGIAGRVHFLGACPHEEVALWMNVADVLCLSSRSEGMPNVVIEALVSGLPVAATDVGACREMLAGEPAARVCPPNDAAGLAGALEVLAQSPIDRRSLARRHADRYSWRRQAETIAAFMQNRNRREESRE